MNKNILINLRINEQLKNQFQSITSQDGYTMSEVIEASIVDIVKRGYLPINIKSKLPPKKINILSLPFIKLCLEEIIDKTFTNKIQKISIFGSYSRGEATGDSDIDLFLEQYDGLSAFDLVHFGNELEKKTGKKVDLITKGNATDNFIGRISREKIVLYEI